MSRLASRDPATVSLAGRLSRTDLLWVANTLHGPAGHWHARAHPGDPAHDHLDAAASARTYLADHQVPVPDGLPDAIALAELAIVRAVVHRMLEPDAEPWTDDARALLEATTFIVHPDGRIASATDGWRGFCRDLLPVLVALVADGPRLRQCSNPQCRLMFEDGSRNHARRWCDNAGCGNRDRVSRAQRRHAHPSDPALPTDPAVPPDPALSAAAEGQVSSRRSRRRRPAR